MTNGAHLKDGDLASLLDGTLDAEARRQVLHHLDGCEDCRAEWIATGALIGQAQPAGAPKPRERRAWWVPLGLAVAAGLAGLVLSRSAISPDPADTERAPAVGPADAAPRIISVVPRDGASLVPGDRTFTWRAYAADSYRFVLLAEDGTPLWSIHTHDTSLVLPPDVHLAAEQTYFWRVDAVADGITASTGTMRLRVSR
jgi:hypothetical protein